MELYKIVALVAAVAHLTVAVQERTPQRLLVAAAASLSAIGPRLAQGAQQAAGLEVRFNFAGSNTLSRQIVEGARVDVFVSADEAQMDVLETAGRVIPGSRADIVGNQLVVIGAPRRFEREDLARPDVRRVAIGDPQAVPAGVYGRRWLESVGLWSGVQPKIVPLAASPAVVAAVAAGRADTGIVYLSDMTSRRGDDVDVLYRVPVEEAPRIVYPAAAIVGGHAAAAREFIAYLRSAPAQEIFRAAGFRPLTAR